jgi:hypothetical protein
MALAVSLACAACQASAPPRASSRATHWVEPPLVEPTAFRIETVLFEVPVDLARSFGVEPSAHGASLGVRVDETGRLAVLESSKHPDIRRLERPSVTVEPGRSIRISAASRSASGAAPGSVSDSLDLDVAPSISYGFAPVELVIGMVWRDAQGELFGRMSGSAPQPAGQCVETMCVPAEGHGDVAIFGYVRAVPVFADASGFANLDPGESVGSAEAHLANVGDVAIRYAVDGTRAPVDVALGTHGRAEWTGDTHALAVQGGAHALFVCIGQSNAVTVTFGDAEGGGRVEFHGDDNRCTNVENGFATTEFESRPKSSSARNWMDLGREPGNRLAGPWRYGAP